MPSIALTSVRGRPSVRRNLILTDLRRQIVAGDLPPGARLPTRTQMQSRYEASADTVQQAMQILMDDGLVEVRGNTGTFVVLNPPHLNHYALVYPEDPARLGYFSYFYKAFTQVASRFAGEQGRRLDHYYIHEGNQNSPDYVRLANDIRHHRLAGLIFTASPHDIRSTPIATNKEIPKITISSRSPIPGVPAIRPDRWEFYRRAVDELKSRGRKRIALITTGDASEFRDLFDDHCLKRAIEAPPHWRWGFSPGQRLTLARCVESLMRCRASDRPDGVIVADDNLVEMTTAGVAAAGRRAGIELDIVAYCNFPAVPTSSTPVIRLGFDIGVLGRRCMDSIDAQRRGVDITSDEPQSLPAIFEHELSADSLGLHAVQATN